MEGIHLTRERKKTQIIESLLSISLSLHVGKEIFDVSKANIQSDHNHLFVRHQKSMQAQAVFRTKLAFRYDEMKTNISIESSIVSFLVNIQTIH